MGSIEQSPAAQQEAQEWESITASSSRSSRCELRPVRSPSLQSVPPSSQSCPSAPPHPSSSPPPIQRSATSPTPAGAAGQAPRLSPRRRPGTWRPNNSEKEPTPLAASCSTLGLQPAGLSPCTQVHPRPFNSSKPAR
ncbi:putative uncharacterized protein DDB_G0290521 [Panicum virgatum]|uniref:putative uncharacterized protein DDB_G0290521 n=1 Tax=Panicum virgatum TaxID=38727 RepID=UPI0019D59622|nr:putative uncharacterized protein DDB_G0290521 [Panicum virgatum]